MLQFFLVQILQEGICRILFENRNCQIAKVESQVGKVIKP